MNQFHYYCEKFEKASLGEEKQDGDGRETGMEWEKGGRGRKEGG